ncbi:MAG: STAS domain-containing protein [Planctomycetota bacterium]
MKIDKSLHDDYAILTLKGEFDTFYCPALMQEVEALVERGVNHLVLDMRLVKFINSTALGAVIKAHKRCRAEGGELFIAQPSPFVRDVIRKVGIDSLVTMHDTEQEATKAIIKHLNQKELVGDAPVDHEKVLITFSDEIRNKMIGGKKTLIGTMANVDGNKLQFFWDGSKAGISADQGKQLFFAGSEVQLKFQVKMLKKSFFELVGVVDNVEPAGDGIRITAKYKKIADAEREALSQFAADMAFLKQQLPEGGGKRDDKDKKGGKK